MYSKSGVNFMEIEVGYVGQNLDVNLEKPRCAHFRRLKSSQYLHFCSYIREQLPNE